MAIFKQGIAIWHQFVMVSSSDHVSPATGKSPVVMIGRGPTSVANTATNSPATELDSTNLPGVYAIFFAVVDVSTPGEFHITCSASGCDDTDEHHQVQYQIFPDVQLAANGRALIAGALQQNTAVPSFPFSMTNASTGQLMTGLTVTATRSLAGAAFAPCTNPVSEIGGGAYTINLSPSDMNAKTVALMFTAPGANALNIPLILTP